MQRLVSFGWAALFVALALLPAFVPIPYYLHLVVVIGIYAIVLLGMDVLLGYTGQVSLGHAAFFGVGAYTAGLLTTQAGWPFWLAVPMAIGVASAFGLLLAAAALRVSGPYLAMVTLAFGTIVQILINEMAWLTKGPIGLAVEKPFVAGAKLGTTGYYYLVLVVLGLSLLCVNRWVSSHIGRAFEALRDSPIATECMGLSVVRYKAFAFALSAALTGLGGALYAGSEEYLSPNTYSFELSILFLLGVIFGGRKSRAGALIGATMVIMLPTLLDSVTTFRWLAGVATIASAAFLANRLRASGRDAMLSASMPLAITGGLLIFSFLVQNLAEFRLVIFGLLILLVVFYLPDGVMGLFRGLAPARAGDTVGKQPNVDAITTEQASAVLPRPAAKPLQISGVVMRFGGLVALQDVSLNIQPGTIHGLIGPNGSGKSTMMNVLTGVYVPASGSVRLANAEMIGRSPAAIANSGVARTFQNVQLFGEMSATQNVMVGLHRQFGTGLFALAVGTPRASQEEASARAQALRLLRLVGLASYADVEARDLPYGKQRLLEIARALALNPSILLLDEPAAGLTAPDIAELMVVLGRIRDGGITMILIEHHVDMVMRLCDTVSVLDFGQKIAEGTASQVQNDPTVLAAYLGSAA
jgi:branched-chain amino acid transport system permease protein